MTSPEMPLWAANGPRYLLETLLRLEQVGWTDSDLCLLPVIGHWAQSEVTPVVPEDDALSFARLVGRLAPSGSAIGDTTTPAPAPRPRFQVNVRRDQVFDDTGVAGVPRVAGRLASFFDPLLGGLPAALPPAQTEPSLSPNIYEATQQNAPAATADDLLPGETWLDQLVWQMCQQYPELIETVAPDVQSGLQFALQKIARELGLAQSQGAGDTAQNITALIPRGSNEEWAGILQKIADRRAAQALPDAAEVQVWADLFTVSDPLLRARRIEKMLKELPDGGAARLQADVFPGLSRQIGQSGLLVRIRIVRELMEWLTTTALLGAGSSAMLFGMAYSEAPPLPPPPVPAPGRRAAPPPPRIEQMFLSGGLDGRTLLAHLMQDWTTGGGFLGISGAAQTPDGYQQITALFSAAEQRTLFGLLAWRRDVWTPFALFAQATRLFIHPDVSVWQKRYTSAPSRLGTLLAQPGATTVLSGRGQLLYPGLEVRIPLVKDGEGSEQQAGARLRVLARLFVPVSFRLSVVWQAEPARLDRPIYLKHPFQKRLFLTPVWNAPLPDDDLSPASDAATL